MQITLHIIIIQPDLIWDPRHLFETKITPFIMVHINSMGDTSELSKLLQML